MVARGQTTISDYVALRVDFKPDFAPTTPIIGTQSGEAPYQRFFRLKPALED
jgi:hypothetical protein